MEHQSATPVYRLTVGASIESIVAQRGGCALFNAIYSKPRISSPRMCLLYLHILFLSRVSSLLQQASSCSFLRREEVVPLWLLLRTSDSDLFQTTNDHNVPDTS